MRKKALAPSVVTTRDPKGLKVLSITGTAYDKAALNEEEAQLVNEAPGWNQVVADFINKYRYPENSPLRKFEMFLNLGVLTVQKDYDHATRLASFYKKHQDKKKPSFYYYNSDITDGNFSNPSRVIKPGDKFQVDLVRQIVPGTTTSEERMAFLHHHNAVLLGAQGASLVFDQEEMRRQLPKGKWHASFDEKERLWQDADGHHRVPRVGAHSDGGFEFYLGRFESVWRGDYCFFLFRDLAG